MPEWLTTMEGSKPVALLIFFITFIAIVLYIFTGKKRKQRLESYKYIPFADEEETGTKPEVRETSEPDEKGKSS
ncbi:MAG: CcoQ/FixQ family Cbb3-type cytochrome c oxidase assembly chaperone [Chromatiales bacterium]|jgi:cbb3-type cytochrome oxidase subunit 3